MSSVLRAATAACLLLVCCGCGAGVLPQVVNDADRVSQARRLLAAGDATLAVDLLKPYAITGGGASDIDVAIHLMGLAHLRLRDWVSAQGEFERLLRDYPESDSALASAFWLGEAFNGQSRGADFDQEFTLKALAQWQEFLKLAPPSDPYRAAAMEKVYLLRVRLATKLVRTGELYLQLREWKPARTFFEDVMRDYADTPLLGDARIGTALADGHLSDRAAALATLRDLEREFAGRPLGERASKARRQLERAKAESGRRRPESVEGPAATAP